jgi:hypothetical protein
MAEELLNPADKQNVPKAVKLVEHLVSLRTLTPPLNPSESQRRRVLVFLARTLHLFVAPFTTVIMTPSQQIRSLSTYSHLAAAMYLKHRLGFLTGAPYADSQAIVKNIMFCTARLQLVDKDLKFFIIHEGTDRLEIIFSDVRTQDHSRNFDVLELSQKLSSAAAISTIFERYPDLDRGHRRLDLKDATGNDRINPTSWLGNVRVGDVELSAEWTNGQRDANSLLEEYFGVSAHVDFHALWSSKPGLDLLRPLDPTSYVGSQYCPNDECSERSEDVAGASETPNDDEDGFDDIPVGVDIEDFLEHEAAATMDQAPTFDTFLIVEGKKSMKSSVVTCSLTGRIMYPYITHTG